MEIKQRIVIIGAGLCGSLLAIRLAQRGYKVRLVEKRADMRKNKIAAGRSINLALSDRGLRALRLVGLEAAIRPLCIPMNGRMIHAVSGATQGFSYSGRVGECINSVSRSGLNSVLLDAAEALENIEIFFQTDCIKADFKTGEVTFFDIEKKVTWREASAIILGTDGAGSILRQGFLNHSASLRFNFAQDFLSHGYKELTIPAGKNNAFCMEKNALHIWPRGTYMLIALPNLDGSFTATLFLPYTGSEWSFEQLSTKEKVLVFFETQFPDALHLMPDIGETFFAHPTGTLGTIKCFPWQHQGKFLLLGDAAHAIVPFYGQGMNASFEDVLVFDTLLDQYSNDWEALFHAYQTTRKKDTDAIADLAIDNFYEMRDQVSNPTFIKKRALELALEQQFPNDYYSKYSMVTFRADMPYSEAMQHGRAQDTLLLSLCAKTTDVQALDLKKVVKKIRALHK
jgi:kynurenine 3-monooxygenase